MQLAAEMAGENDGTSSVVGLNPEQQSAVEHVTGPIVVLAGAGSGKTRVLTNRIVHLIRDCGVAPGSILAVTFTNKATEEMRQRIAALLGERAGQVWVATFHSAALRILRHHASVLSYTSDFVVYDDQDSKSVIKGILKELSIDEQKYPVDSFSRAIDAAKNEGKLPSELVKDAYSVEFQQRAEVYSRYQQKLLSANAMDFGDLLLNVVRLLESSPEILSAYRHRLHYLLVDEFQDTNVIQYRFIRLLSEPRRNLFVVGDDDQSIYAFRGATIRNILEFERDFPNAKVVKLEQNYRSTGNILDAAHSVIHKNKERKSKKLWTAGEKGDPLTCFLGFDENSEADYIASEIQQHHRRGISYKDIAVLYRTNAQTRALEEAFLRFKIPYRIFGGLKFYDRKEIKDILAYLKLLVNPADDQSFQRVINTPPRGIGAQTLLAIAEEARHQGVSLLAASFEVARNNKNVAEFLVLMAEIKKSKESLSLAELISFVVEKSEYGPKLRIMKDPQAQSRLENLEELVGIGRVMEVSPEGAGETLRLFLDRVTLSSSADLIEGEKQKQGEKKQLPDAVSLMTLHLAKGLEFDTVFLTGLEEGLLPHFRSIQDPNPRSIEEERRLCYVGITRARKVLYLTRAFSRAMFSGGGGSRTVSRFAKDIPDTITIDRSEERTPGGSFLKGLSDYYEGESYSPSNGGYDSGRFSRRVKAEGFGGSEKKVSSGLSLDQLKKLLVSAEEVTQKPSSTDLLEAYRSRDVAPLEQLQPGVRVCHKTLGFGVVEAVDSAERDPRIIVKFDTFDEQKKLMFSFARLVVIEG
jgi:DNA helicase II / ATP-dependent DNA helicase PcrA